MLPMSSSSRGRTTAVCCAWAIPVSEYARGGKSRTRLAVSRSSREPGGDVAGGAMVRERAGGSGGCNGGTATSALHRDPEQSVSSGLSERLGGLAVERLRPLHELGELRPIAHRIEPGIAPERRVGVVAAAHRLI